MRLKRELRHQANIIGADRGKDIFYSCIAFQFGEVCFFKIGGQVTFRNDLQLSPVYGHIVRWLQCNTNKNKKL